MLIQYLAEYFCTNSGLVVSTQPETLHRAFDFLVDLFARVSPHKSKRKMVSIDCQPCHMTGIILVVAY